MIDNIYWIWFQQLFGVGTRRAELFLNYFENPLEIYEGVKNGGRVAGMLTEEELAACGAAMARAEEIRRRTLKKGVDIVTPDSESYPDLLQQVYSKPAVLYVKGDLSCLKNKLAIAMVGAREYTEYGKEAAILIAKGLACGGAVVVSGLAHGIDSESHKAALKQGGKTIGVLGCGIDVDYPKGSAELKRAMCENGAVVAEYPVGSEPLPYHFPVRNRVISGMSHGVVVVEAAVNSGSLVTARHALEQGRDIFAVPGGIFSARAQGTHLLIRDGAKLTENAQDIFDEYEHLGFWKKLDVAYEGAKTPRMENDMPKNSVPEPEAAAIPKDLPEGLSGDGISVLDALGGGTATVDAIAARADFEVGRVLCALTELEIYGLIQGYPGRKFGIKPRADT